jgi:lipid II:glycine glycyltransferase (peptidoglycan interpeptide bridge formation enzyme)
MRITLLSKDEIIAGGSLSFTYMPQKTVYGTYLALNRNLKNTYSPSYNLWWETINWAWNRNFGKISFGRQKMDVSNPRYRIKSEFGTDFIPMYSKIFSLSRIFTLAYRGNQSVEGLRNLVKERIRSRCE